MSSMTMTRRVNRIFRIKKHAELSCYGLYTPPEVIRLPSDAPPPSESSTDMGSVPFKVVMVPMLDEEGNPMLNKKGEPIMKKQKVVLDEKELEAAKGDIEAEKKRKEEEKKKKEEEEQRRKEEEERAAKLAAMREENMKVFKEITGGKEDGQVHETAEISRKMGFAPTAAEITAMHAKYGETVTYDDMLQFMSNELEPANSKDELMECFKRYDKSGEGTVPKAVIHNILTGFGEPLTAAECDCLLNELNLGDPVNYSDFCEMLLAP